MKKAKKLFEEWASTILLSQFRRRALAVFSILTNGGEYATIPR